MELIRIPRLAPREYEHPFDRKALDALENTRGVETLVRKFNELGVERAARIIYTGSNLKVTPSSLPEVHDVLEACCDTLDLPDLPELYLRRMDAIQGATVGVNRPLVVLSTEAVELLAPAELRFVVGREVGHIKSQHMLYHQIGVLLPVLSEVLAAPTMGLGALLTAGIQMALVHWVRMSEFTADRAGLLASQDVAAATGALAKIAGLPPRYYDSFSLDDFVTQAREFEGLDGTYDRVLKFLVREDHLWTIARAHELLAWTDTGGYRDVLERRTEPKPLALPLQGVAFCTQCGARAEGPATFCSACGMRLAAV